MNYSDNAAMAWVYWLPFLCVLLHVTEEFAWPGGFSAWYHAYRPAAKSSFTPRYAVGINALLLAATAFLGLVGPHWSRGTSLWLVLAALLAANAVFHLVGAWRMRRYSPGMVTGVCLYLPLCAFGYVHFLSNGQTGMGNALLSLALGASSEFWLALTHRLRTARMETIGNGGR